MTAIEARGLRKVFGGKVALDNVDLRIEEGRIVGLVGPNGAGKTTALNAIVGLTPYEGHLAVLGHNPWRNRDSLMRDVCFIADVAVLPRWIRTSQIVDYVAGVHPKFDRTKADRLLSKTRINRNSKVRELSKGMVAQLHLALCLAIDARLLVLDEPTLGLDPLFRREFYDTLLNDYFDGDRTIIISTNNLEEVQHILTDLIFIDAGRIALSCNVGDIEPRFVEVSVHPDRLVQARELGPIHERQALARTVLVFDGANREQLAALGDVRTPNIPDLFVAVMSPGTSRSPGAEQ